MCGAQRCKITLIALIQTMLTVDVTGKSVPFNFHFPFANKAKNDEYGYWLYENNGFLTNTRTNFVTDNYSQ